MQGAYSLKQSDPLATSLSQITGPAHIPYNDSRWQQILLHYEKLVHLHNLGLTPPLSSTKEEEDVVASACRQCAKYSATSSNLAALSLHVARMIRDLQSGLDVYTTESKATGDIDETSPQKSQNGYSKSVGKSSVRDRISLIGKARVTCGSINLLRILSHETIVQACCLKVDASAEGESNSSTSALECDTDYVLTESFTYRSRTEVDGNTNAQDAAMEIISSTMAFLSSIGCIIQQGKDADILSIPEMYDTIVHILSLLLVLLSTQLYQPMISSAELATDGRQSSQFFLQKWMQYSNWQRAEQHKSKEEHMRQQQAQNLGQENMGELHNEPLLFLYSCLHWLVDRPSPPRRSIASHFVDLPKSVAKQMTNMVIAPDGMYESHNIVMASVPHGQEKVVPNTASSARTPAQLSDSSLGKSADIDAPATAIELGTDDAVNLSSPGHVSGDVTSWNAPSNLLSHPIRSILLLSSTFFLLPIRLVRLAFNLLGHARYRAIMGGDNTYHMKNIADGDRLILQQLQAQCETKSGWNKTNNILWLSDSPVADLGSALVLILSNNCRSGAPNPFRAELASLSDNRWAQESTTDQSSNGSSLFPPSPSIDDTMLTLSINFESLFRAFGCVVHTEVGALLLYTLLLSSPIFAESVAAKSDLDTVVMPLLRSLYFSTSTTHTDPKSSPKSGLLSQLPLLTTSNRPFRSQSQLYVILILLLIFSQDPCFGKDSFRRVRVSIQTVKWYKERQIKEASLGSMILLVLLRAITFNLNRLQDGFLLSNCCAVLLNLSPHISDLHEYVAHRLVSVTTSCFKRYATLLDENRGQTEVEGDLSTALGMHGETCRTLLTLIKHSIRRKCLEKNIHLVYALLLEQRDIQKIYCFASLGDVSSIYALIRKANDIIQDNGDGMSADQTLGVLKAHLKELKSYEGVVSDELSVASDASDLGNLTFTYEEEADPEVFFVPYVWDMCIGTLTTTTMEWSRNKIQVFPLNEEIREPLPQNSSDNGDTVAHENTPDVV
ncbi:hypothetical protein ACHAXR_012428 [Thalassiosira sp. AJA248-18]